MPDSSRIAYLADQINDVGVELYTALPNVGGSFFQNSAGLVAGSNVTRFEWAPNSLRMAFVANKVVSRFALYTTSRNDSNNTKLSGTLVNDGNVLVADWVP